MPEKIVGNFSVKHLSILDETGRVDTTLEPKLSTSQLKKMFENMLLMREFDQRSLNMQRQGRMGTYAPALGQEAVNIGTAAALEPTDWAVPSFREHGVMLSRGIKPSTFFLFFMGSEEGNRYPRKLHTLPFAVPCASQILHAVGIGMAAKIKKDKVAIAVYFGDGATSEGDFHEGMNFAGVYQTPTVFICQNNEWAISTPRKDQTKSATLAQKALAYGFEGMQVDGNDILGVYQSCKTALEKARSGQGPQLLEYLTYRLGIHTTADDPTRYRDEKECEAWKKRDPIDRFEKYLVAKKVIQPGERQELVKQISEYLKKESEKAEAICQNLTPDEMFTYMYENFPEILKPQREEALAQNNNSPVIKGVSHG